jgi:hypothetical protein
MEQASPRVVRLHFEGDIDQTGSWEIEGAHQWKMD